MIQSIHCGNGVHLKVLPLPWMAQEQENPCRDSEQMANKGLTQKNIVSPIISMIISVLHRIWLTNVC